MPPTSRPPGSPRGRATTRERRDPLRTCLDCGRRAPQSELERFGAVSGVLTRGRTVPGRGAHTCHSRACIEVALDGRAFRRALRTGVTVGPALSRIYTGESDG